MNILIKNKIMMPVSTSNFFPIAATKELEYNSNSSLTGIEKDLPSK